MSDAKSNVFENKQVAWGSCAIITLIFIGAYFVLRALPDAQCGFLHYEEVVNENGETEFCATNHAGFLDLTRLKYPVDVEIEAIDLADGRYSLQLESRGMPLAPHELAVTHTRKMHVMLIDSALEDYHHVHPEAVGIGGRYDFSFQPAGSGTYQVFTEVVPLRSRRQMIAVDTIDVPGAVGKPVFESNHEYIDGDLRFVLSGETERLRTGRDYRFGLDVLSVSGEPANLELIMGAKGHMVAFDDQRKGFAHMHPISSVLGEDEDDALSFLFNVPNSGWYRVFAQIQVAGRERFGRFDLYVE